MRKALFVLGGDGSFELRWAAIGERIDQMVFEGLGIVIEEGADIGFGCGERHFRRAKPCDAQADRQCILRIELSRLPIGGDGRLRFAARFLRFSERQPSEGPVRGKFDHLFEKLGGGSEIAALGIGERELVTAVGDEIARGVWGRLHQIFASCAVRGMVKSYPFWATEPPLRNSIS